jgi:hypothetical protein
VLAADDPWIPAEMEVPRRGAVPVRFFGTYNFCWIESQRSLAPFRGPGDEERASKSKLPVCPLSRGNAPQLHVSPEYDMHDGVRATVG